MAVTPTDNSPTSPAVLELVGMGFSEEDARDALARYDNNLQKATNFLLDGGGSVEALDATAAAEGGAKDDGSASTSSKRKAWWKRKKGEESKDQ